MRKIFLFLSSAFILSVAACLTTYDSAIIYHKNFNSGSHPFLRFDGYYRDSLGAKGAIEMWKPVFLYQNGSAFSCDNYIAFNDLENNLKNKTLKGSWGNYLMTADTIQLEKFQLIKSNYTRIILRGVISEGKIHWTSRKDHNESFKPVDYTVTFHTYPLKPDSTKNFIRTKEKYNQ